MGPLGIGRPHPGDCDKMILGVGGQNGKWKLSSPSGFPELPECGKGVFDPEGRPALPDDAVDPVRSRVRASVQREDHLPRLFVELYEANLQPSPIKRHLVVGVEKDRNVVVDHEPDVVADGTRDGNDPEVREPLRVGGDSLRFSVNRPCLPHHHGGGKGGVLGDLPGVGVDPENPRRGLWRHLAHRILIERVGRIETPSSVRQRRAGPPFGPGIR